MNKSIFAALSLAAALFVPALSSVSHAVDIRIGGTPAGRIAKDTHIPGKGVAGQCLVFANALQAKFEAAGIPSKVMVYGYEAPMAAEHLAGGQLGNCASHAVVVYEDRGRTYIMDNQSWTPQWIHNGAPVEMAQRFSGIAVNVKVARVVRDSNLPLIPADLKPTTRLAMAE